MILNQVFISSLLLTLTSVQTTKYRNELPEEQEETLIKAFFSFLQLELKSTQQGNVTVY